MSIETQKQHIQEFFENVALNVVFREPSKEGYIEAEICDSTSPLPSVFLSVPVMTDSGDEAPGTQLSDWQKQVIEKLLSPDYKTASGKAVEIEDDRAYLRSGFYGGSRYHIVSQSYTDGLVIEQSDHNEKYQQRVTLEPEEVEPLLRTLLSWHLRAHAPKGTEDDVSQDSDNTEKVDDHPF